MKKTQSTRRALLKSASTLPFLRYAPLLAPVGAMAADCSDAKSLVCVFLEGGADSYNFVVPGGNQYDVYAETRGSMAVAETSLLSARDARQGDFGFNDLLPDLRVLYQDQQLAVVSNIGNLIQPTTPADFEATISLPQSLFAHDAQRQLWQTASGDLAQKLGWGGAIAEHISDCNAVSNVSTSISIAGSHTWLSNLQEQAISLSATNDVARLAGYSVNSSTAVQQAMAELLAQSQASVSPYERGAANAVKRSIDTSDALVDAVNDNPVANMTYSSSNSLAQQLHMVARLIAAREQLSMRRQVFFVQLSGWDTHNDQLARFGPLLSDLNEALSSFQAAITDMSKADSVTTFTASDFGRTLTSNGDGTDHGWGGHGLVIGGSVTGGRVYGDFPSFASTDNPDDAGNSNGTFAGRIIPQLSVAQYGATFASWMGVEQDQLDTLFPTLTNFPANELGFLAT